MKGSLEELRKLAVNLFLKGRSVRDISKELGFSRYWVYKWYNRYLTGDKEWFKECSKAPHHIPHKTSPSIEQTVVRIRKKLMGQNEFYGAQAIHWEMEDLGYSVIPPISTINMILKRNNLVEPKRKRYESKGVSYPTIKCHLPNILHESDFVGPRYLKGGFRFYVLNLMDIGSHRVGIELSQSKRSQKVVTALIAMWKRIGIPKYLQMDNQLPFRGSNKYPRSFGAVIKLCISLGIQPIFIPIKEPWRNSYIEKFGDVFQNYFFNKIRFDGFKHLIQEAYQFEQRHNSRYRYSFLKGQTPMEFFREHIQGVQYLPEDYSFEPKISLSEGYIHLIRFIRSNRMLKIFGEKFTAPQEGVYEYLWCTIDIKEEKLKLFLGEKQIEEYNY